LNYFIPGPLSGIYAATVEHQLRQTMRNQLDNFEEAGLTFDDVVAEEITTWSPVQKSRPESPVCSVVCDVGEVGG